MPVYDYTYQTWTGARRSAWVRWLTIPKFTYLDLFKKRVFISLFTGAWLQFVLRLGYIYLLVNTEFLAALNMPTRGLPAVNGFFFKNLIDVQLIFCFIFAFMLGSDLISKDLRHSGLVLFLSKPISRWEYFLGKFTAMFGLMMGLTWLQAILLFGLQTAVAPEQSPWRIYFWSEALPIAWAINAYCVIVSATLSILILASSSLTKNQRYAGTFFAIYLVGSTAIGRVVGEILGRDWPLVLSPFACGVDLGYHLFDESGRADLGLVQCIGGIAGVWIVCIGIFYFRLRNAARYGR
ncbi:ABC transporter permease subunit [bacterium]|nr:ABC transporter permease subunit [bacterium]